MLYQRDQKREKKAIAAKKGQDNNGPPMKTEKISPVRGKALVGDQGRGDMLHNPEYVRGISSKETRGEARAGNCRRMQGGGKTAQDNLEKKAWQGKSDRETAGPCVSKKSEHDKG